MHKIKGKQTKVKPYKSTRLQNIDLVIYEPHHLTT